VAKKRARSAAAAGRKFIACTPKFLPKELLPAAAQTAREENPANDPDPKGVIELMLVIARKLYPQLEEHELPVLEPEPIHTALLQTAFWGGPRTLGVYFMDTQESALKSRLLSHFNAWDCGIVFLESSMGNAEIRVARFPDQGYYSYLGTDCLHIPQGQPTMNLEAFTMQTPESEYRRVARHEPGHTLGFPHEHARPEIVALLNPPAVIAWGALTQGWSEQMVRKQILDPIPNSAIPQRTAPDVKSIMAYEFDGSLTLSGKPIPGGLDIDPSDAAFAAKIYPKAAQPGPPTASRHIVYFDFHQDVPANGLVYLPAFPTPIAIKKGRTELIYPAASSSPQGEVVSAQIGVSP
jgi:hypothetical protein